MVNEVYAEVKDRMKKIAEALERDYKRIRTGRASVSILDGIRVDYYGSPMPLSQVASLSVPDPRTILIQPWDASIVSDVEKAILKSELGLTPSSDGKAVRISIPPLTEERRRELVKVAKKMAEEAKVSARTVRHDAIEMVKDLKKDKLISEDEQFKAQDEIQKITDDFIKKIDGLCAAKEKEILEV